MGSVITIDGYRERSTKDYTRKCVNDPQTSIPYISHETTDLKGQCLFNATQQGDLEPLTFSFQPRCYTCLFSNSCYIHMLMFIYYNEAGKKRKLLRRSAVKIGSASIGSESIAFQLIMNKDEGETSLHGLDSNTEDLPIRAGRASHKGGEGFGAAGSGYAGLTGALNDPAIYLALNTLALAICHKPRASLCAIRLPLNCSKLAAGFFTLCLYRTWGERRRFFPCLFQRYKHNKPCRKLCF